MALDESLYEDREQTLIKHIILSAYLERFAHIIGFSWPSLTYVDCFSGPWNHLSEEFEDTSFGIAIEQLRLARKHIKARGHAACTLRCLFLEKDAKAFAQLESFASEISDIEIKLIHGKFEDCVGEILEFIQQDKQTFPFLFVDPTGWNGIALETLRPLLQLNPGEVIVNFMTSHIRRFVENADEKSRENFSKFYATSKYIEIFDGVYEPQDREDAIVNFYCSRLEEIGKFEYVSKAIVLNPEKNSTHFHLIYGTRHPKGLEEFKRVEQRAMAVMEKRRAAGKDDPSETENFLFDVSNYEVSPPTHYELLRERYLSIAYKRVLKMLRRETLIKYDDAWATTLLIPLSWEKDLKEWIKTWLDEEAIEVIGLNTNRRVPQRGERISLKWIGE